MLCLIGLHFRLSSCQNTGLLTLNRLLGDGAGFLFLLLMMKKDASDSNDCRRQKIQGFEG